MNWDRNEADWDRFKGIIKLHWARISDEQVVSIAGRRDRLVDVIQNAYGHEVRIACSKP